MIPQLGETFGRWTVIGAGRAVCTNAEVLCRCTCSKAKFVLAAALRAGRSNSCGCIQREQLAVRNTKHGGRFTHEYRSWLCMQDRCRNPHHPSYNDYGGAGIVVCPQWNDFVTFQKDMGPCPAKHEIDRIDNSKGYEPGNCRWVTRRDNLLNRRRALSFYGKKMFASDIAKAMGISLKTLYNRRKQFPNLTIEQLQYL
mgnify:CR=1 FL=1